MIKRERVGDPIIGPPKGFFGKIVWALFGNERDGYIGDSRWNPDRVDNWKIRLQWWLRNPLHNFMWHVIGFAHEDSTRYDVNEVDQLGLNTAWTVRKGGRIRWPSWLYLTKGWMMYFGRRGSGAFGIACKRRH